MLCAANCLASPSCATSVLATTSKPGRILVDAVDDPRPRDAADARKAATAMVEQGVDQRPVAISGSGVDDQPGGLVDDQQMLVLEHDRQRNVLRLVMRRGGLGHRQLECFVAVDLVRRIADRLARAGLQRTAADQRLQPLARQSRDCRGKRAVEPPAHMVAAKSDVNDLMPPGHVRPIWVRRETVQCLAAACAVKGDAASSAHERRRSRQPALLAPVP